MPFTMSIDYDNDRVVGLLRKACPKDGAEIVPIVAALNNYEVVCCGDLTLGKIPMQDGKYMLAINFDGDEKTEQAIRNYIGRPNR